MERPIFKPLGTPVAQLDTPALVVDLALVEHNIATLHAFFQQREAKVRPHVTAHRCPALAHKQLAAGSTVGGIYSSAASATTRVVNCTVADNLGGIGLLAGAGLFAVTNSIVTGNSVDLSGFPQSSGVLSNVWYSCISDGQNAGVQGTPTFFLAVTEPGSSAVKPAKMLVGAQPFAKFKEAIEGLLSSKK